MIWCTPVPPIHHRAPINHVSIWHNGTKRKRYEEHGLRELWLIDPRPGANPVVRVVRRSSPGVSSFDVNVTLGVDDVLGSPLLEGFSVKVRELLPLT